MHDTIRDFDLNDPETYKKVFRDHMYKRMILDNESAKKVIYYHEEYLRVGYILLYIMTDNGPRFVANKRWDVPENYIGSWETAFIFRRSGDHAVDELNAAKKLHYVFGMDVKYARGRFHLLKHYKLDSGKSKKVLKLYSMDVTPFFVKANMDDFEPEAAFKFVSERQFRDRSKNPLDKLALALFYDHYESGILHQVAKDQEKAAREREMTDKLREIAKERANHKKRNKKINTKAGSLFF